MPELCSARGLTGPAFRLRLARLDELGCRAGSGFAASMDRPRGLAAPRTAPRAAMRVKPPMPPPRGLWSEAARPVRCGIRPQDCGSIELRFNHRANLTVLENGCKITVFIPLTQALNKSLINQKTSCLPDNKKKTSFALKHGSTGTLFRVF